MSSEDPKSTSSTSASRDRSTTDEKIRHLYWFMSVVVLAVVATYFLIFFDFIKEKEWFLKYTEVYMDYTQQNNNLSKELNSKVEELNKLMGNQRVEIENLKGELDALRRANSYLK